MGYYATWDGNVKMDSVPTDKTMDDIQAVFACCEYDLINNFLTIYGNGKYRDEDVISILEQIKPSVINGEICFTGEDDSHWRFVYRNGNWEEEQGEISYNSDNQILNNRKEEFIDEITNTVLSCLERNEGKIKEELESFMKRWEIFE